MKIILKFGGTSVGDSEKIRQISNEIKKISNENQVVIIVSAFDGITNLLLQMCQQALRNYEDKIKNNLEYIQRRHLDVLENAISNQGLKEEIRNNIINKINELKHIFEGVNVLGEITPRSKDLILSFGEALSASIMSGSIRDYGLVVKLFVGGEVGITTDEDFGEANPLMNISKMKIRKALLPIISERIIPVITGFIASTQEGEITTLGRGGSDYSATIIGSAISADEIWICTDVDGMMTADPKIIKSAKKIPRLSYAEALEMAVFGAKSLHPRAIDPVIESRIPVRVKNSINLDEDGTVITEKKGEVDMKVVKSVALIKDVGMINIWGAGLVGKTGVAGKVFQILAKLGINILMISQSISEANISMIIKREQIEKAVNSLEISLLGKGYANKVTAEDDVSVIAVVGEGMKGSPGVASRVFQAVSLNKINIMMIAQGSSELNISFVVKEKDSEIAVRNIHKEFNLGE